MGIGGSVAIVLISAFDVIVCFQTEKWRFWEREIGWAYSGSLVVCCFFGHGVLHDMG